MRHFRHDQIKADLEKAGEEAYLSEEAIDQAWYDFEDAALAAFASTVRFDQANLESREAFHRDGQGMNLPAYEAAKIKRTDRDASRAKGDYASDWERSYCKREGLGSFNPSLTD